MHHKGKGALILEFGKEIASGVMLAACLLLAHFGVFQNWSRHLGLQFDYAALLCYIIAVIPVGITVLSDCIKSWGKGDFMNEFTLMFLATTGAYLIGEYPEGVAILLFYSFGEKLENRASDDVRKRVKNLLGKLPESVNTIREDGIITAVKPEEVAPGTLFIVKPGERIPIDGILESTEETQFDTSAITGESVPRNFKPGDSLDSGMIPLDKAVRLRSTKLFADSSMSRIMKMIEEAQEAKSPTENLLRRITRRYTPVVLVLAVLLFTVAWIVAMAGGVPFQWELWLKRSLVFLVCSCPCALVVSVPLSYFSSIGAASRRGLLFKGGRSIDALRDIDTVAFDKTGTLTTGNFHVAEVFPTEGHTREEVLSIALSLDKESAHPLAKAVVAEAGKQGVSGIEIKDITTIPHGMRGIIDGKVALLGSLSLMRANNVAPIGEILPEGSTAIHVALDGKPVGIIALIDDIKPESAEGIAALRKLGIKNVTVLSGDRDAAVARVAKAVGADSWHSSQLPSGKQTLIKEMEQEGKKVAFVGDGINDAPAIAAATSGISMGTGGTDIAMQSADIVIATDRIDKLAEALALARKVKRVVMSNVGFALGVKILVMTLGAFGIATLWAAVFADTGVTLITIISTVLCLNIRRESTNSTKTT